MLDSAVACATTDGCARSRPPVVPVQEGWCRRVLSALWLLLFGWPERLLRRAGCPLYHESSLSALRGAAIVLLLTLIWKLASGGGSWGSRVSAAFTWLALELALAACTTHPGAEGRRAAAPAGVDKLAGRMEAMVQLCEQLSTAAPPVARLANAAIPVLAARQWQAQLAVWAAQAGRRW